MLEFIDNKLIEEIIKAAKRCDLEEPKRRSLLLNRLTHLNLALKDRPLDQLRSDVLSLAEFDSVVYETFPLVTWLKNACGLVGDHPNAASLKAVSDRVERLARPLIAASQVEAAQEAYDNLREADPKSSETEAARKRLVALKRESRQGGHLREGDVLKSRFALRKPLGEGGFGQVWQARDKEFGRTVALKVLHPHLTRDRDALERFVRGARSQAKLADPAIVPVFDFQGEDGGFHFIVMEFVNGPTLAKLLAEGRIERESALKIVSTIAGALNAAHARGMIHRDVKPANILMAPDGPKLTDFDLVLPHDTTGGTRTGQLGTLAYAAPECLKTPGKADARADQFSLAMVAAALLGGREPTGEHIRGPRRFIEGLPLHWRVQDALLKATALSQSARFESLDEFVKSLAASLANNDTTDPSLEVRRASDPVEFFDPEARVRVQIDVHYTITFRPGNTIAWRVGTDKGGRGLVLRDAEEEADSSHERDFWSIPPMLARTPPELDGAASAEAIDLALLRDLAAPTTSASRRFEAADDGAEQISPGIVQAARAAVANLKPRLEVGEQLAGGQETLPLHDEDGVHHVDGQFVQLAFSARFAGWQLIVVTEWLGVKEPDPAEDAEFAVHCAFPDDSVSLEKLDGSAHEFYALGTVTIPALTMGLPDPDVFARQPAATWGGRCLEVAAQVDMCFDQQSTPWLKDLITDTLSALGETPTVSEAAGIDALFAAVGRRLLAGDTSIVEGFSDQLGALWSRQMRILGTQYNQGPDVPLTRSNVAEWLAFNWAWSFALPEMPETPKNLEPWLYPGWHRLLLADAPKWLRGDDRLSADLVAKVVERCDDPELPEKLPWFLRNALIAVSVRRRWTIPTSFASWLTNSVDDGSALIAIVSKDESKQVARAVWDCISTNAGNLLSTFSALWSAKALQAWLMESMELDWLTGDSLPELEQLDRLLREIPSRLQGPFMDTLPEATIEKFRVERDERYDDRYGRSALTRLADRKTADFMDIRRLWRRFPAAALERARTRYPDGHMASELVSAAPKEFASDILDFVEAHDTCPAWLGQWARRRIQECPGLAERLFALAMRAQH